MSAVFKFRSVPADWSRAPAAHRPAPAHPAGLRVSVVVPTVGHLPLLMRCLQALLAQNADRHSFEILVVDAGRDRATRRAVQALARTLPPHLLHYLRPLDQARSAAAARNRGWQAARAPLVAFTDERALPDPDWLLEGDKAMHAERCIALSGRVRSAAAVDPATGPAQPTLDSANTFVWRKALQAVGGFDERFPDPAHEDADLQFRLQREGPIGRSDRVQVLRAPAGAVWSDVLRQQHDRFFDALLYREHPLQYRRQRGAAPPWTSYAIVALAVAGLVLLLAGSPALAQGFAAAVVAGVVALGVQRWHGSGASFRRLPGMLLTSALVPFLAVYWRLRGAWHYRVWFV